MARNGKAKTIAASGEHQQAADLLAAVIAKVREASQGQPSGGNEARRLFFPSGIELISLRFNFGSKVDITLVIAGKDAPVKVSAPSEIEAVAIASDGRVVSTRE